ncbi:MAG: hypothetical protein HYX84_00190 [Chloroflexi bacterium]|nr:hypothetical protein [Chloroflexota bacterium]
MTGSLFELAEIMPVVNASTAPASQTVPIGFIVLAVILTPVVTLLLISMFGNPRTFRVPALFLGGFVLLVGALVLGFAALSLVLKFFVPQ